jgi:thiamine kinase-like enzyme
VDPRTSNVSLFLEYLKPNIRASDIVRKRAARQPRALAQAARWIGQFHAWHAGRTNNPSLAFLTRYDAEYYRGWAQRTLEFSRPLHRLFPWLPQLCKTDQWFAPLLDEAQTVIHGEFYAKTVLVQRQRIFVVDWESAAIAPGEIDLAALTEGKHWPARVVQKCERAYVRARWPEGVPPSFSRSLDAARIYLHFRWLGERPDWTVREKNLSRFDHLHASANRLGLL